MIDWFVILTPILLLAVIALLGFVGCDQVFGLSQTTPGEANQVGYVNTAVFVEPATPNNGADTTTFNAGLSDLHGGELIVITLQWKGNAPTFTPNLTTAAGPYDWQLTTTAPPQTISDIQVFTAMNAAGATQFTVQVQLNSVVPWSICLSAYNTVDISNPTYSPLTTQASAVANNSSTSTGSVGLSAGDALYAFGIAAEASGSFPSGANNLAPGPGLTPDNAGNTNPLVEHLITSNSGSNQSLPAVVVNQSGSAIGNLFVLGMGIKAEPLT